MSTRYITPEAAAADPRVPLGNADWWRQQLRDGKLRGSKIGGRWMIDPAAIDEMIEAGSNTPRRRRRRSIPEDAA